MDHRRRLVAAGAVALSVIASLPTLPAQAAPAVQTPLGCAAPGVRDEPSDTSVSFAGRSSANDLAIGVPGASRGSLAQAGLVEVRYSCSSLQGTQVLRLPTAHAGDRFGAAATAVNLNDDVYTDLAVGVPHLDVGRAADAGGVALFLGSPAGLVYNQTLTQATPGVPGAAQAGAHFGATLSFAAQRWWDDEPDGVLAVGAPDKDVAGVVDAGAVVLISTVQSAEGEVRREITLDTPGTQGAPGRGDHLGAAIDIAPGDFALGLPGRKVAGRAQAGAVLVGRRSDSSPYGYELLTQNSSGISGSAEQGDRFGSAVAGGWVGVPGEDLGGVADAGLVQSVLGYTVSQETAGVPGRSRAGDRLGSTLAISVSPSSNRNSAQRVLVGMPGRDVAGVRDAGAVLSFRHQRSNVPTLSFPAVLPMPDPERDAHFGSALAQAGLQVVVGAPGAGGGRGRVEVYATPFDAVAPALVGPWTQTSGAARGNGFGSAFGGIPHVR